MSCGIYKITNPKGKIYIGQSINIEKRIESYKKLSGGKNQRKLYNSLLKYSPKNHFFEIIELCDRKLLNKRERYWQDFYDTLKTGLNLLLTDDSLNPQVFSEESKKKIKQSLKTYFESLSKEEKSIIYGKSSRKRIGQPANRKNYVASEITRKKISESNMGRKVKEETKEKIRQKMLNRVVTWGNKISQSLSGKPNLKNKNKGNKIIMQYNLNGDFVKEWASITLAAKTLNITFNSISNCLCGYCKTAHKFIWKYKNITND